MSRREFSDWLTAFVDYNKAFSETPEKFLYWSGVSAIAAALERRVWIDQGRYSLYPNFYIVLVADPGRVQKSTTINTATSLLKKVPGINLSPKSCTWEGFIKLLSGMHRAEQQEVTLEGENTAVAPIMVAASELSVFLDPSNEGLVSSLIELWDCGDVFDRFTKMYGMETVEKPCVNIFAGTTPAWIRQSFDRWSREGGLIARTIFLYETEKRQLIAFPKRHEPANGPAIKERLIRDLIYMTDLRGEFIIEEEAYLWGEEWYKQHDKFMAATEDVTGLLDRKQAHVLKLAMILSASRRESRRITVGDMREATEIITSIEPDFAQVFSVVDDRAELRPYNEIRKLIARHERIEWSRLVSLCAGKYLLHEIERVIAVMVNSEEIERSQEGVKRFISFKGKL